MGQLKKVILCLFFVNLKAERCLLYLKWWKLYKSVTETEERLGKRESQWNRQINQLDQNMFLNADREQLSRSNRRLRHFPRWCC